MNSLKSKLEQVLDSLSDEQVAAVTKALETLNSPEAKSVVGSSAFLIGVAVTAYGRTARGVNVIQKAARGETLNRRDAYKLLAGIMTVTYTVVGATDQYRKQLKTVTDAVARYSALGKPS